MAKLCLRLLTGLNTRPDTMQRKSRKGRAWTKTPVEDEIAHLRGLDLGGLRARWQSVFQRSAPAHLTRHLLFAIIAYRIQADRQSQRVMVMADGFAWNGRTYDSLSKVAFAITGTKWNGLRFFGLRHREDLSTMEARP
jgi:hypothetical protein